ncbi:MAG: Uncharacterised protein [Flavobacteriia bacterium]|nr:MAG: Uncharacterised protein [Flavobacteriia bacterium]
MAKQTLWGHHHQWLSEAPVHLTPQKMEEIGGRGRIDHLHIVLGTELQEALKPGTRMFGSLALIAVGKKEHQSILNAPFVFGCC